MNSAGSTSGAGAACARLQKLRANGQPQDIDISCSDYGTADGRIPRYILIAAPPTDIPWRVQYDLSLKSYVGRLPFSGDALGPYITAMLDDWSQGTPNLTKRALVWATDYGPTDITRTMAAAIAAPLRDKLNGSVPVEAIIGAGAKADALLSNLDAKPGLVVTSSHGSTPIDNPNLLASTLGLPVGQDRCTVNLNELDAQMPCGSLWFTQACCSAGSSGESLYTQLLSADSSAWRVVSQVAALGSTVAPAALRLLGRENPVRAVLGHVEPTFNWTLQDGSTGQLYGSVLVTALSSNLYAGQPIGMTLAEYRLQVGLLNTYYHTVRDEAASDTLLRPRLTRLRLTALDRQALVLLGDPTVAFPNKDAS
jgi:hypothetical protein